MNWIKTIYRGEKKLVCSNQTIMVSLVMAKLYSPILGQKISSWAEHHHKRAFGQASLGPKHSIIVEESLLQG